MLPEYKNFTIYRNVAQRKKENLYSMNRGNVINII